LERSDTARHDTARPRPRAGTWLGARAAGWRPWRASWLAPGFPVPVPLVVVGTCRRRGAARGRHRTMRGACCSRPQRRWHGVRGAPHGGVRSRRLPRARAGRAPQPVFEGNSQQATAQRWRRPDHSVINTLAGQATTRCIIQFRQYRPREISLFPVTSVSTASNSFSILDLDRP